METDPNQAASFRMMVEMTERNILRSAFDMPIVEVYAWDAATFKIVVMNDLALDAARMTARQSLQMHAHDLLDGLTQERLARMTTRLRLRHPRAFTFRLLHKDHDGNARLSRIVLRYIDEPRGTVIAFVQNITRHLDALTAAHVAQDMFKTAIESLPDGFVLYDADDRLVICNEKYRQIYKHSAAAMFVGQTFRDILQYGLDRGEYAAGIGREAEWLTERMAAHTRANVTVEQELSSGQWLRIVERKTSNGGRVGLRIDITELKENEAKLEKFARTDPLTGLMNRRGLTEKLAELSGKLAMEERIALLHIDLDKFKSINDTQGHDAGDFVLTHCANLLCEAARSAEAVARVGGDEFIVLLQTTDNAEEITAKSKEIINLISTPISFRKRQCNVGASIGIAIYDPTDDHNVSDALTAADIALNVAKQAGRGQSVVFEQCMRDGAVKLVQLAHEIRLGLVAGEFEPFFQPQVNTKTGEIIGFEALIRWRHPQRGLVPAFEFLPAAERAGLMPDIDEVVVEGACAAAATMQTWGLAHAAVSINMSMPLLQDPEIVARLKGYCRKHGIKPDNLRLELLESTLLDERSEQVVKNVHKLIQAGFSVELDDFGTGHAAIATLRKFSVSRIKIDRSLVKDIDTDAELRVITGAIINLAARLGVSVLAEGVETPDEQTALNTMGCVLAQGYHHGRPMPLEALRNWVLDHAAMVRDATYHHTPDEGLVR